ncbi:hypothetical protein [Ammoniphilus sp. CFH 90114]|uniref:hypothetical protein n=1 Tax=Ammoniphilus sp. CFH 90114 TaxID=2493665 RepID=UPI00100FF16D|nr:hypothetical protein [Ammoniphilus sp. CFH 90114]RXT00970.1 hypothetical protein EIZ39_25750 [Ammoniphilus sp. CFH 90114]
MTTIYVNQVFGVSKDMVLSYVEREEVDVEFNRAAASDKHIVVYGSSKQGKSALVQKHIAKENAITIGCTPRMTTKDIYSSLLRQIGITIESSKEEVKGTNGVVSVKTGFKAIIPLFGQANTEVKGDIGGKTE